MSTESVSSAEAKLANLVIKRYKLEPGFDVAKFLSTQADLRFGKIPDDVDGISLFLKSKDRQPVVIISSDLPATRQKFTMAHELGHVFIPWHIGTIFSHTDENHDYANLLYHDGEVEANRFAAELLMPTQWVESLLSTQHPATVLETICKTAGTSHIAAFYKIGTRISSEYIGVLTNLQGKVVSSISNNARLVSPQKGDFIKDQAIFKIASEYKRSTSTQNHIYWLRFSEDVVIPTDDDPRSWRDILYPIIEELHLDKKIGVRIIACISALNKPGVMNEEFFLKARQRIASDDEFFEVSKHPDFELFLAKRIDEQIRNRANR